MATTGLIEQLDRVADRAGEAASRYVRRNPTVLLAVGLVLVTLAGMLSWLADSYQTFPGDQLIAGLVRSEHLRPVVAVLGVVSQLGNSWPATLIFLGVALWFFLAGHWLALRFLLLTPIADLLVIGLKLLIQRPRPEAALTTGLLSEFAPYGFPSGHVVHATVFFGFIAYVALRQERGLRRFAVMAVCLVVIVLMGPSRVFLGVHWASDVLGGYLIGLLFLALLIAAYRWARARLLV